MAATEGTDGEAGWIAAGFRTPTSPTLCPSAMATGSRPLDAGLGLVTNDTVWDVHATTTGQPPIDGTNSLRDVSTGIDAGWSFVQYTRDLNTGDGDDVVIGTGGAVTCIQYAYGAVLDLDAGSLGQHPPNARFTGGGIDFENPGGCSGIGLNNCTDCLDPARPDLERCFNGTGICDLGSGTCIGCTAPQTGDYCANLLPMDITSLDPDRTPRGEDPGKITILADPSTVVITGPVARNYSCEFVGRSAGLTAYAPVTLALGSLTMDLPEDLPEDLYDVTCSNDGVIHGGGKRVFTVLAPPAEPFNWQLPAAIAGGAVAVGILGYGALLASRSARESWTQLAKKRRANKSKTRLEKKRAEEAKRRKEKEDALFRPLTVTETKVFDETIEKKKKRRASMSSGNSKGSNDSGYGAGGYGSPTKPKSSSMSRSRSASGKSTKSTKSRKSNKPRAPRTAAGKAAASGGAK